MFHSKGSYSLHMMNPLILRTGFRVFATARSLTKIQSLATKGIEVLKLDVSRSESIAIAQGEVKRKTGGKLDFLINNAWVSLLHRAFDNCLTDPKGTMYGLLWPFYDLGSSSESCRAWITSDWYWDLCHKEYVRRQCFWTYGDGQTIYTAITPCPRDDR